MNYVKNNLENIIKVDNIVSLHYFCYTRDFKYAGECHDFCELVFVDSGEVTVIDGEACHVLKQGEGFLHTENIFHNIYPNDTFANIAIISFYAELPEIVKGKKLIFSEECKTLINIILSEGRGIFCEPLNILHLEKMSKRETIPFASEQVLKNCIELLLIKLIRSLNESSPAALKNPNALTDSINTILERSVKRNISLAEIAEKTGYSVSYIKRVYKSVFGNSILNSFNNLKIHEAKKYIADGLSSAQICEILGFESEQYFCRQFKKFTNMTPGQYRKSVKLMRFL